MANEIKNANNAPVELIVDDGSKTFEIKNAKGAIIGEFTITPSDLGIYERYVKMQDEIDEIVKPLEEMTGDYDLQEFTAATAEIKARLFAAINRMFGTDQAEKLFGNLHPFSPVGGQFYFARVLEVVGQQISATFEAETKLFSDHVKKYTNRAQRRAKK